MTGIGGGIVRLTLTSSVAPTETQALHVLVGVARYLKCMALIPRTLCPLGANSPYARGVFRGPRRGSDHGHSYRGRKDDSAVGGGESGNPHHGLREMLIHPDAFDHAYHSHGEFDENILGIVGPHHLSGEMILSKPAILAGFVHQSDKQNVGIHQFAHLVKKKSSE